MQKLKKIKHKYMEMYENDVIDISELKSKTKNINEEILKLNEKIKLVRRNIDKSDLLKNNLSVTFKNIEDLVSNEIITNNLLSKVIQKITVDENSEIDVYLKLLKDVGLENIIPLCDSRTQRCI